MEMTFRLLPARLSASSVIQGSFHKKSLGGDNLRAILQEIFWYPWGIGSDAERHAVLPSQSSETTAYFMCESET
jgi:hypothetical protein